jgi:hypothetical protein
MKVAIYSARPNSGPVDFEIEVEAQALTNGFSGYVVDGILMIPVEDKNFIYLLRLILMRVTATEQLCIMLRLKTNHPKAYRKYARAFTGLFPWTLK